MKEITPVELSKKIESGDTFQLIDVREAYEREICHINGEHLPMGEILNLIDKVRKDIPVIVHCRSGQRSAAVISTLESKYGFENLFNLKGGILGYAKEVDTTLELY